MRKSLLGFMITLAGFLAFLVGFSEALRFPPLARLAFLRLLLIAAGMVFFGRWALRIVFLSPQIPESLKTPLRNALCAISQFACRLIFSPRVGLGVACAVLVFTALFSVWYASLGMFPQFPQVGNLYINQASAFLKGQAALLEVPSPQVLALPDPYSFTSRQGVSYVWDASLYNGRYFLYWGPVPAAILAGIMAVSRNQVPDSLLVVLSAIGISVIMLVLLWQVRKHFFPQSPAIFLGLFVLVSSINLPYLFLIGRGRVYETSIITGQCFLLFGLTSFYSYWQSKRPGLLVLAGLSWGLSIACRYVLVISVAVFLAFGLWMIWRTALERLAAIRKLAYLFVPLGICMLGIALFNWIRFNNPLESGLQYQLSTPVYQNQHFSFRYFRTNLYLNVLYPYRDVDLFPLIRSIAVQPEKAPAWVNYSPGKRVDETVFSIRLIPFFWLFLLLLPVSAVLWWIDWRKTGLPNNADTPLWPIFGWMVGLAGFLQFFILLFYYYTAVRFMADFYLAWMLVAIFLIWSMDRRIRHMPWLRAALWIVVALSVIATVLVGFLAGFDNPPLVFQIYNPAVEAKIAAAWNTLYTSTGMVSKTLRYFLALIL